MTGHVSCHSEGNAVGETPRPSAEGRARIAGRQVVDAAGKPAAGHDLTQFVERTLARV